MSFKDTFTRDDKQEDMEFDYSAFWTYAATFLIMFLILLIWKVLNRIFYSSEISNTKNFKNCDCSFCKSKIEKYVAKKRKLNYNGTFYFMILMIVVLSYLLLLSYNEIIENDGKLKGFNPFDILEINEDSTVKEIKKAFRRKSVKWHPDKNAGNNEAKAKYIMIIKAYEALTDPVAKENWEKYGNPDGAGSMRLSIALPPLVYNKKNHMPILIIFLLCVCVIFPAALYMWYNNSQKFDENGVRVDNQRIYYEFLNENVLFRQIAFIVGASGEFSGMKLKPEQAAQLDKLVRTYKDKMPKHKESDISYNNKKAICLLYAFIENEKLNSDELTEETMTIVQQVPELLFSMYKMSCEWTKAYMQMQQYAATYGHVDMQMRIKAMGYNCIRTILEFSQCVHQQANSSTSPFMQLPHFNNDKIRGLVKVHKKNFPEKNLSSFLGMSNSEAKDILQAEFKKNEIDDILIAKNMLPLFDTSITVEVDGFEEILVEDLVTFMIKIKRKNIEKKIEIGMPHSNAFPTVYDERVAVLITKDTKIIYETHVSGY